MTFQEFKSKIIDRCKVNDACEPEFKKVLQSENFASLFSILKNNFHWSCENKILDTEILQQVIEVANENDVWVNVSVKSGFLLAYGNATVEAYGNATVEAYGNATVEASDNATVRAYDNATVQAYDNATVQASDNATVQAYDNATVRAYGNATVEAYGNATVRAYGNATVEASDNVYTISYNLNDHKQSEKSIVRYYYTNEIRILKENQNLIKLI